MAIDRVRSFPGVKSLAITCDPDSAKYNDYMILSPDTAEDSVIMTRSFTSMIYLSVVLAFYAGGKKDKIEAMKDYAAQSGEFLKAADAMAKRIVAEHPDLNLYITLGQGINYGIANECMNKMKEMSLSNSEGYYSLEYRHGPMSLVDDKTMIRYDSLQNAAMIGFIGQWMGYYIAEQKNLNADTPRHLSQAIVIK